MHQMDYKDALDLLRRAGFSPAEMDRLVRLQAPSNAPWERAGPGTCRPPSPGVYALAGGDWQADGLHPLNEDHST